MKYTEKAFEQAKAEYSRRRKQSALELERREQEICEQFPAVKEIQNALRNTYFELVRLIASHSPDTKEQVLALKEENLNRQKRLKSYLKKAGRDEYYLDEIYICEKCKDTGYAEGEMCSCHEEMLKKFTIEEMNNHSTIALQDFSSYNESYYPEGDIREHMNNLYTYFMSYCRNFPNGCRSMLFEGQTGLGKTFLSSCIAKKLIENGYVVAFGSVADYLRKIENEHFNRQPGDTLSVLLDADMLIIDDLGSEFLTPFYEASLYNIINGRMNLKKPTIISTNLSDTERSNRYNERICSRLENYYMPMMFMGKDIRQSKTRSAYMQNNNE